MRHRDRRLAAGPVGAAAAARALDEGRGDTDFLRQKVVTARFFAEQVLPQAAGLVPSVTAGPADLLAAAF